MILPKLKMSFRGFTLIELMVAISIIAVLAAVGFTSYSQSQKLARDSKRKQDIQSIANALELFYGDNRRYPTTSKVTDHGSGWAFSKADGSNWIIDRGITGAETTTSIAPLYIPKVPSDPISNGNAYSLAASGYFYYSDRADPLNVVCKPGQYYILIAKLENPNDPDTGTKNPIPVCNQSSSEFAPAGYLISRQ
jgi:prepilin-type N-terminal cleavage/methylation domain-containing protein